MRFKKLEIFGFKSFATKTTVNFEPGVTAIVGPNGSGKSNIVDSIRWVLGESNPRDVRAPRLEDVIFNGTDKKAPLSMAEVQLTISNEQGLLPISFAEVTITRRVYRSGETECFINGSPCRLKDIRELFLGTGLGGGTYAIIEQGHIDLILSSKPEERRIPFEEASGVAKYLSKKAETIRRLDEVEEHLVRLADIITEVRRQVNALERQANRARQYKTQWERLKDLELRLAADELRNGRGRNLELDDKLATVQAGSQGLEQEKIGAMQALETAHTGISAVQAKLQDARAQVKDCENQIEQNNAQLSMKTTWIQDLSQQAVQVEAEIKQLTARLETCDTQLSRVSGAESEVQLQLSVVDSQRAQDQGALTEVETALRALQESVDKGKTQVFEVASRLTEARNRYTRMTGRIQELQAQTTRLESGHSQQLRAVEDARARVSTVSEDESRARAQCEALQQQIAQTQPELDAAEQRRQEWSGRLSQSKEQLAGERTQGRLLHDLWRHYEGFSDTVKTLMGNAVEGLIGPLVDLVQPIAGYEEVVEAALGPLAEAIVVHDRPALSRCRAVLDSQGLEGARFIVLSDCVLADPALGPSPTPAASVSVREVVQVEPAYQGLVNWVLNDSWVVEDLKPLMIDSRLPDARIVSRRGERWDRRSWRLLGSSVHNRNNDGASNVRVGRKQRWEQAQHRILTLETEIQRAEAESSQAEKTWHELLSRQESAKGQLAPALESLKRMQTHLAELDQVMATADDEGKEVITELSALETERAELTTGIAEAQRTMEEATVQQQAYEADLARVQAEREGVDQSRQQLRIAQAQIEANSRSMQERAVQLGNQRKQILEDREAAQQQIDSRLKQREEAGRRSAALAQELEDHRAAIESLRGQKVTLESAAADVERSLKEEESRRDAILPRLLQVEQQLSSISQEIQALERRRSEMTFRRSHVVQRLRELYQIDENTLAAEEAGDASALTAEQQAEAAEEVAKLRSKLEGIGPVSLGSVEEYDDLKRRLEFLQTQQQDLLQARDDLRASIAQINKTAKIQFKETFDRIRLEFQHYYGLLFNGGQADLILMDENDVLSSGIDIVARPPGKRLQSISLLSGGERALTAIAILFSLFKVRPSPFCILDEIDAPLDEANVDRFTRVLAEFLELSQFILITHNKKTITKADSLYGVTMAEAGISSILSVKFKQVQAPAAAPASPAVSLRETQAPGQAVGSGA